MSDGFYKRLPDGTVVPVEDIHEWGESMKDRNRTIAWDELPDGARVSTVFLGLDHSFYGGPPVLWETMIFGGANDGYQRRYTSEADALNGHAIALEVAKSGCLVDIAPGGWQH